MTPPLTTRQRGAGEHADYADPFIRQALRWRREAVARWRLLEAGSWCFGGGYAVSCAVLGFMHAGVWWMLGDLALCVTCASAALRSRYYGNELEAAADRIEAGEDVWTGAA